MDWRGGEEGRGWWGALYSSGVDGERSVGYSRLPYDNEKRGEGRKGEVAKEKERTR